jgi:SAM-dependent methyltransferase
MGIDFNSVAVRQARAVARFARNPDDISTQVADIFEFEPPRHFDVVNSIGVLHHTRDCHGAIRRICSWLQPGDHFHLGLYHCYSRRPFLDHFKRMQEHGASVVEMFEEFRSLKFGLSDDVNLYSWFRDQVIHPHETQHSFEEIADLLEQHGFQVCSTSINNFKRLPDRQSLIEMEKALEEHSRSRLKQGHYFPGFFTILALKK